MRFHWQNLNEQDDGRPKGSGFWHGRAWLHLDEDWSRVFRLCWAFGRFARHAGVEFTVGENDSDREVGLSVRFPYLAALWLSFEGVPWHFPYRTISLSVHGGSIWWRFWADPDLWESSRPMWRDGSLDVVKLLIGAPTRAKRVLSTERVDIPFPERTYASTVELAAYEERRPRWPFPKRWRAVEIVPDVPVPEPGKGENAWDCGDDFTSRMYLGGADSIAEGVDRFRQAVLQTRQRRGGERWVPTPEHIAMCERVGAQSRATEQGPVATS